MRIPLIGPFLERRDDLCARALRVRLGEQGRIVSWHLDGPRRRSPWVARVSCRHHPETIEARGRSRKTAILAADQALTCELRDA